MIISFDEMPNTARVWIYQANRTFQSEEISKIESLANTFFNDWAAHGAPLKSAYKVLHNKFIVIAVDESFNKASGCSIDASVALIRELASELNADFFDRSQVCFLVDDEIIEADLKEIKALVEKGTIQKETLTFNNLVPTVGEFKSQWLTPSQNSWLARYF